MEKNKFKSEMYLGISIVIGMIIGFAIGIYVNKVPISIALGLILGSGIGSIFRNKYGDNKAQTKWTDLSPKQKMIRITTIIILAVLVLIGLLLFLLYKK